MFISISHKLTLSKLTEYYQNPSSEDCHFNVCMYVCIYLLVHFLMILWHTKKGFFNPSLYYIPFPIPIPHFKINVLL